MDDDFIIPVYLVLEEICQNTIGEPKYKPKMSPAEILLVAIVAARYFNNNLERALLVLGQTGHIPLRRRLSVSRFNRQLHQYRDLLELCLETLLALARDGEVFIIDSMPMPVCKRKRARRCRKVRGRAFCGYCSAKEEKFFGWRLHLICTPQGLPVNFTMLPGALHDLTPIYELSYELPAHACLFGDKAYNDGDAETILAQDGLRLIPIRRKNMKNQHGWAEEYDLRLYRKGIETVNSQLESMALEHLRARTNEGFFIKVHASLIALWQTQWLAN
jgi:hypothetical protein